jgi:uncharacterized membrane protein YtjA (UPF0391 family)
MFAITFSILATLTIVAALFAFGVISIPAAGIAKALFICFIALLAIDIAVGRKHV